MKRFAAIGPPILPSPINPTFAIRTSLFVARYSLFVIRCSLFVVRYSLFIIRPLRYSNSAKHVRTVSKANARITNNAFYHLPKVASG
ncbi:hypothetical protein D3795_02155 [Pseudidiomarina andamanensis]|uniref:Uncharacterized protein n=1 Tax=Pseudidiomarina andamanensis TaxID=1940690 RepID=A0AA92ESB0_9GAMM|nr:hypothetical protein D3795_02155 [Pseudidiomarina andamanensis]